MTVSGLVLLWSGFCLLDLIESPKNKFYSSFNTVPVVGTRAAPPRDAHVLGLSIRDYVRLHGVLVSLKFELQKHHRLGDPDNDLDPHNSGGWKPELRVLGLSGRTKDVLLVADYGSSYVQRGKRVLWPRCIRALVPFIRNPLLGPNQPPKAPTSKYHHMGG